MASQDRAPATGRQTAETSFRELLELAPDGIVLVDAQGQIKLVNHRAYELFGYEPTELIDREVEQLVPNRFRSGHLAHRAGYVAEPRRREMGTGLELYGRRKDGSEFPVEISLSPMRSGADGMVIAIVREVSDRKAAELEQAALRHVATLVARAVPAQELFTAATEEVRRLLELDHAHLGRYESDGTVTILADSSSTRNPFRVGSRWSLDGENLSSLVARTGRPARIDSYPEASGPLAVESAEKGIRAGVGAPIVVADRLWGVMIAASTKEQPLPADTETRLASFTDLVATAIANAEARAELTASRARIIAAGDEARARVVRDLHDGAQQSLVNAVVSLKLASRALTNSGPHAGELLDSALRQTEEAGLQLRELSHGLLPPVLGRSGLAAGVEVLVSRMSLPVSVDVTDERFPAGVESTAYFVVSEALTNVVKHAYANSAEVTARVERGALRVEIVDNGVGGLRRTGSSGLSGLEDRVSALGGTLIVDSPSGQGTRVCALMPLPDDTDQGLSDAPR